MHWTAGLFLFSDGFDASLESKSIDLAPGATTGIISVNIIDDAISETRETYIIQLLPVSGVQLIQDRTEIIINDDDGEDIF